MQTMLKFYAEGCAGIPCGNFGEPTDLATLMKHAAEQGIWQSVLAGVNEAYKRGDITISDEQQSLFDGKVEDQYAMTLQSTAARMCLHLINEMFD